MGDELLENKALEVYREIYKLNEIEKPPRGFFLELRHIITMHLIFSMSILIPLFGLFFYIIWKNDRPEDAKWPGYGTVLGFIINISIGVIQKLSQGTMF